MPVDLDVGGSERNRNEWNRYDLDPRIFGNTTGIEYIRFGKAGSDAWCVDEVQLYLNRNDGVRTRTVPSGNYNIFYHGVYTPHWIDGDGQYPFTYTYTNVGARLSTWTMPYLVDATPNIRMQTIADMFESAYGHEMSVAGQMYDFAWGSLDGVAHAEIGPGGTPYSDGHLDLDLRRNGNNRDYDVNFGGMVNCTSPGGPIQEFFFQTSGSVFLSGKVVTDAALRSVAQSIFDSIESRLARHPAFVGHTCPAGMSSYVMGIRHSGTGFQIGWPSPD